MMTKLFLVVFIGLISISQSNFIGNPIFVGKPLYKVSVVENSGSDCGNEATEVIHLKVVSTSPDYIPIPGNITLTLNLDILDDINAPLAMNLTLKKKVSVVWIQIPCISNFGSCFYEDACALLPNTNKPDSDPCPHTFPDGVPCKCPLKKDDYFLNKIPFHFKKPSVDFSYAGSYQLQVTFSGKDGSQLGCIEFEAEVQDTQY